MQKILQQASYRDELGTCERLCRAAWHLQALAPSRLALAGACTERPGTCRRLPQAAWHLQALALSGLALAQRGLPPAESSPKPKPKPNTVSPASNTDLVSERFQHRVVRMPAVDEGDDPAPLNEAGERPTGTPQRRLRRADVAPRRASLQGGAGASHSDADDESEEPRAGAGASEAPVPGADEARGEPRALGPGASAQPDTGWVGGAAGRNWGEAGSRHRGGGRSSLLFARVRCLLPRDWSRLACAASIWVSVSRPCMCFVHFMAGWQLLESAPRPSSTWGRHGRL